MIFSKEKGYKNILKKLLHQQHFIVFYENGKDHICYSGYASWLEVMVSNSKPKKQTLGEKKNRMGRT